MKSFVLQKIWILVIIRPITINGNRKFSFVLQLYLTVDSICSQELVELSKKHTNFFNKIENSLFKNKFLELDFYAPLGHII